MGGKWGPEMKRKKVLCFVSFDLSQPGGYNCKGLEGAIGRRGRAQGGGELGGGGGTCQVPKHGEAGPSRIVDLACGGEFLDIVLGYKLHAIVSLLGLLLLEHRPSAEVSVGELGPGDAQDPIPERPGRRTKSGGQGAGHGHGHGHECVVLCVTTNR